MGDRFVLSSVGKKGKVVKKTRDIVYYADEDGNISKYRKVETPKVAPKKVRMANANTTQRRRIGQRELDQLVSEMPKCSVNLQNLSQADIDRKIAEIERGGQMQLLRRVDDTIEIKVPNQGRALSLLRRPDDTIKIDMSNRSQKISFNVSRDVALMIGSLIRTHLHQINLQQTSDDANLDWIGHEEVIKIKVSDTQGQGSTFFVAPNIFQMLKQSLGSIWLKRPELVEVFAGGADQNAPMAHFLYDGMAEQSSHFIANQPSEIVDAVQDETNDTLDGLVHLFEGNWFSGNDGTVEELVDKTSTNENETVGESDHSECSGYDADSSVSEISDHDSDSGEDFWQPPDDNYYDKLYRLLHGRERDQN